MISIEASTRTCKVDTASAARIESDRFLNPNLVMCPNWNGTDLTGRTVCPDSFYTKRAGCNSAADRVIVENNLRPAYFEYINLSAAGIRDDMYKNNMHYTDAGVSGQQKDFAETKTGNFGLTPSFPGTNEATCSYGRYSEGQMQMRDQYRVNESRQKGMKPGMGSKQRVIMNKGRNAHNRQRQQQMMAQRRMHNNGNGMHSNGNGMHHRMVQENFTFPAHTRTQKQYTRQNAAATNGYRAMNYRAASGF